MEKRSQIYVLLNSYQNFNVESKRFRQEDRLSRRYVSKTRSQCLVVVERVPKSDLRLPGISRKMDLLHVEKGFSPFFVIFDDFSKFHSTFGVF